MLLAQFNQLLAHEYLCFCTAPDDPLMMDPWPSIQALVSDISDEGIGIRLDAEGRLPKVSMLSGLRAERPRPPEKKTQPPETGTKKTGDKKITELEHAKDVPGQTCLRVSFMLVLETVFQAALEAQGAEPMEGFVVQKGQPPPTYRALLLSFSFRESLSPPPIYLHYLRSLAFD
jgi:hypothetical protein